MRPVLAVRRQASQRELNWETEALRRSITKEGKRKLNSSAPPKVHSQKPRNEEQKDSVEKKGGKKLTGAGAHRGVLDVEESLGVSGHVGCCLMEWTKREERGLVAIEDGGEGTRSEGARWG